MPALRSQPPFRSFLVVVEFSVAADMSHLGIFQVDSLVEERASRGSVTSGSVNSQMAHSHLGLTA